MHNCWTLCRIALLVAMTPMVTSLDYGPGTTPQMHDIFIGRCLEYQHVTYKTQFANNTLNCTDMWNLFFTGFGYKAICAVTPDDFRPFMEAALINNPPGERARYESHAMNDFAPSPTQLMLWSHTSALIRRVSGGGRFYGIENTMVGHVVDMMRWCGQVAPPGVAYGRCLKWWECRGNETNSEAAYWRMASTFLSQSASGHVYALLNGTYKSSTFTNTSVFATIEIPHLNSSKVTEVTAWVVHDLGKPVKEKCGTGTLVDLEKHVKAQGIKFSCVDDPPMTENLLCSQAPEALRCRHVCPKPDVTGGSASTTTSGRTLVALTLMLLLIWTPAFLL